MAEAGVGDDGAAVDRPPADPRQLLATWMEWENGETPPGQVISRLKTAGLRLILEELAARVEEPG